MPCARTWLCLLSLVWLPQSRAVDDWPGFRGPHGDNISSEVPTSLPAKAAPLWKVIISGQAHGGVAVADGRVVTMDHEEGKRDIVRCFDARTGKPLWTYAYANTGERVEYGDAPRATPLIYRGMVFALGARGQVCALKLATGELAWRRSLLADFGGEMPKWGYCSSPVVAGGRLIVSPGGKAASVVALDPATGAPVWASPGAAANYGSFVSAVVSGAPAIIGFDQAELIARSAADGRVLWRRPVDSSAGYLVPTPVVAGSRLLLFDGSGAHSMPLAGPSSPPKWEADNELFLSANATPAVTDGMVIGTSEGTGLVALDAGSLMTQWTKKDKGALASFGHVVAGSGRVLVLDENGTLHLFAISRTGCRAIAKLRVCGETVCAPALVGDRLYVRDHGALHCYDLGVGRPTAAPSRR